MKIGVSEIPVPQGGVLLMTKSSEAQPRKARTTATVLKLTQVGEARSLRRSGKRWLRNSAKWPRNFGIRGACASRPQQSGAGDCLLKTQDSANSQEDV